MIDERLDSLQNNSIKLIIGFLLSGIVAWGGWITKTTLDSSIRSVTIEQQLEQVNYKLDMILKNFDLTPKKTQ